MRTTQTITTFTCDLCHEPIDESANLADEAALYGTVKITVERRREALTGDVVRLDLCTYCAKGLLKFLNVPLGSDGVTMFDRRRED